MRMKVLTTTLAALACAAIVGAQQPPPAQVPPAPPSPAPAPAPTQRVPEAKSSAASSITVTGCIERKAEASSATPGAVGTAGAVGGANPGFVLTKVMKPTGTAGSSSATAAPVASSYRLDGDDSKLSPQVGHKVEIMGTLDERSSSSSAAADAPRLKVDSVKMIAATCTE